MSYQNGFVLIALFSWFSLVHNDLKMVSGENKMRRTECSTTHPNISASDSRSNGSTLNLKRDRRAVYPDNNQNCYKQFFVKNQPPTGLRSATNNIKYICQQIRNDPKTYYATMFDEQNGIAVYSAYFVNQEQLKNGLTAKRKDIWEETPGITRQGTEATYKGQRIYDRGHLLPFKIYSFDKKYGDSTFTYTNAVPQVMKFNRGEWSKYEKLISNFALDICRKEPNGVLYLITGTTNWLLYPKKGTVDEKFKGNGENPIRVPASMWTTGCCLKTEIVSTGKGRKGRKGRKGKSTTVTTVVGNFAVIGRNLRKSQTQQLSVKELQNFLKDDAGITTGDVSLFPGNPDCSNKEKSVDLSDPVTDYEPQVKKGRNPNHLVWIGYKNFRDARK